MFKDHAVGEFLKGEGYRYYQLGTWFGPTRSIPIADENLALGATSEFETVLNDTDDHAGDRPGPRQHDARARRSATATARARCSSCASSGGSSTAPGPKFVFAHILLPHDPYVFRADGSPLTEAEAKADARGGSCTRTSSRSRTRRSRPSSTTCSRAPRRPARS